MGNPAYLPFRVDSALKAHVTYFFLNRPFFPSYFFLNCRFHEMNF
jgi:hypothetical protein